MFLPRLLLMAIHRRVTGTHSDIPFLTNLFFIRFQEREREMETKNTSLKDHIKELKEKLNEMTRDQLQKTEQVNKEDELLSREIATLKSELSSSNAAKAELTTLLDSSNGKSLFDIRQ